MACCTSLDDLGSGSRRWERRDIVCQLATVVPDVSPAVMWDVLTDLTAYPEWNPFAVCVGSSVSRPTPGVQLHFTFDWSASRAGGSCLLPRHTTELTRAAEAPTAANRHRGRWSYTLDGCLRLAGVGESLHVHRVLPRGRGSVHTSTLYQKGIVPLIVPPDRMLACLSAAADALAARCRERAAADSLGARRKNHQRLGGVVLYR